AKTDLALADAVVKSTLLGSAVRWLAASVCAWQAAMFVLLDLFAGNGGIVKMRRELRGRTPGRDDPVIAQR
ncbi:MAG: hypothetical protein JSW37_14330, partial [Anaerolineales bacterium]